MKEVYNTKAHAEGQKNLGSKKTTKAKAQTKSEANERMPKINKYGFLHINKDLAKHLGIELGKDKQDIPVQIEHIEDGFIVRLKIK